VSLPARTILSGSAQGPILACDEPLSFWGGVDPASARVIDIHHPLHGQCLTGAVLVLPGTRGSCTGSGVLLDMVLSGLGPAALIFRDPEDVVTLGAMIAAEMFGQTLPVLRLSPDAFSLARTAKTACIEPSFLTLDSQTLPLPPPEASALDLTARDRALLDGTEGQATALAMRILCAMAVNQGAQRLIPVTQAHIDGCIYASPANLTFAERMADLGARVCIPTTMNAISVCHDQWQAQGVAPGFGGPAQRLADAYVRMGCQPSFTCSPYLLPTAPRMGERIGWSESNAVIFANSALGARTAKHPDFLDLCIAMTGRAPEAGVYLDRHRAATRVLDIDLPPGADDSFWPLIGYLAGKASPDRIPLLRGLGPAAPGAEALKALCAAFGTTSAAPMLHVEGVTPEANLLAPEADHIAITRADMAAAWAGLNAGPETVELVAIGSPHASAPECRALAAHLAGRATRIPTIVTAGRQIIAELAADGTLALLKAADVQVLPDLCWCSISEPVFPPETRTVLTNSGKYAHYGPGLSGRALRFASLAACAEAACSGQLAKSLPPWLA
jgi:cis-L-3-hydroxyproline dehydratase